MEHSDHQLPSTSHQSHALLTLLFGKPALQLSDRKTTAALRHAIACQSKVNSHLTARELLYGNSEGCK